MAHDPSSPSKFLVRDSGTSNLFGELGSCIKGLRTRAEKLVQRVDWFVLKEWYMTPTITNNKRHHNDVTRRQ